MSFSEKLQVASNADSAAAFRFPSGTIKNKIKFSFIKQKPVSGALSIEDQGKLRLGGQGPLFRK